MKRLRILGAALALALAAACGQVETGAGAPAEDVVAEAPAGAEPSEPMPDTGMTAPAPIDEVGEAPAEPAPDMGGETIAPPPSDVDDVIAPEHSVARDAPRNGDAAPSTPPPSARAAEPRMRGIAPTGPAANGGATTGGGRERVTTAVIVEIQPTDLRRPRNGGSAVALLSRTPADFERNLRLCRAIFSQIDAATVGEVIAGERERGGVIQELRPLYWMLKSALPAATGDRCGERISRYDFNRANAIRTKYGLTGRGPYLAIANTAESRVAVVDFGAAPIGETESLVRYFRDGFSQDGDIWTEERHVPATAQGRIAAFVNRSVAGAALTALLKPVARAACPLGDPLDVCSTANGGR